jgi:hypothetical protein
MVAFQKLELKNYELEKCKGAVLRSKAIWATEGDKNNTFKIFDFPIFVILRIPDEGYFRNSSLELI